ncbi:MAG TPA: polysaccharide deacetylase family protein [Candidatus Saccharimonadia bacterium]
MSQTGISDKSVLRRLADRLFQRYVDWRRGNRAAEKQCHRPAPNSILLTFDDYISPSQADAICSLLEPHQIRAMFFFQGDWAQHNQPLIDKLAAAGHIIGNHTYSHANLTELADEAVTQEIIRGPKTQPWLRPPYGAYDKRVRNLAAKLGYVICYWTLDSHDWAPDIAADEICQRVLSRIEPTSVILMHCHNDTTIAALPQIIEAVRAKGWQFESTTSQAWQPGPPTS